MTPERWQQIDRIFEAALERAQAERPGFLDEACAGDQSLRQEVESLLDAHERSGSFIEKPAIELDAALIADQAAQLEAGRAIGRYQIIGLLGAGGMGEVYLAKDTRLGRQVALKLLPALFTTDENRLRRFHQEAHSTSALNHPNILTIHEVGEVEGTHFIATEFIEGETLRDHLSGGALPLREALDIATQIAAALDAAHEAVIVHRDIKPENIMIRRRDSYVKVLDFGLAKLREPQQNLNPSSQAPTRAPVKTDPGVVMGTVNYMSPEQARGQEVNEQTDIWSLGVVLYEMLTGSLPFKGETISDMISSILRDEIVPLAHYSREAPAEIERIVTKSLRKKRAERYQTVRDVVLDLKSLKRRLEFEAELERSSASTESKERRQARRGEKRLAPTGATTLIEPSTLSLRELSPNNLSEELVPLVGRVLETAEVEQMLRREDVRLVTLTGVGGTGKTSLALNIAHEMLNEFADGIFFIELSAINDPQLVISSIAQPLGVKESGGKALADILKDHLREREMLLILDNFEQVTAAAPQVASLLASAAKLKVLVTSRALLHLSAEREFAVPPLSLPDENHLPTLNELTEYAAIELFVERARLVKKSFALTEENARAIAEICTRLEGLPLAIELAAARVRVLSPPAILTRLESQLKLLTGGSRDLPARQQTMRGAIAWSYDLLDADEKTLLNRLSVFAGGATLEAAEIVCSGQRAAGSEEAISSNDKLLPTANCPPHADILDGITSLLDKSLLLQKEQGDGEMRFRMLEAVREYARESLQASGELAPIEQHHANYFLALAERAEPELIGTQQAKWLDSLEEEHVNLRAAIRWSLANDAESALRLVGAIGMFWTIHGHFTEGRRWLEEALQKGGYAIARAKALIGGGRLAWLQGDYGSARNFYEESLRLARETRHKRQIALASRGLGVVSFLEGDNVAARAFLEESLAIRRELEDKVGISTTLNTLGEVARVEGDYALARTLYEEAVALARETGLQETISANLNNLGAVAFHEGDFAAARASYTEALAITRELGHRAGTSIALDGCAALAMQLGETECAAQLAGAATAVRDSIGFELEINERILRERYLAEARAALGEQAFATAFEQGRALSIREAIALALEGL